MNKCMKFHVLSFGLAFGILWGAGVLLMGIAGNLWGWGTLFINVLGSFYLGYEPTIMGSIVGGIWGFFDGFIGGVVFAWLYNKICACCWKCCKKEEEQVSK